MDNPVSIVFWFGIYAMFFAAFMFGGMFLYLLTRLLDDWFSTRSLRRPAQRASKEGREDG